MIPTRKTVVPLCVAAFAATVCWMKRDVLREYASSLAERLSQDPECATDLIRDVFATTEVPKAVPTPGHTHPDAASLRTSATNFAKLISMKTGLRLYCLQMSKSDQRRGLSGSREWYWAKDTNVENRKEPESPLDLQYVCDTDYYMDMPMLLSHKPKPTLLYSVVPEEATTHCDDTATFFDPSGKLVTIVAGGGHYEHYIWDYASDSLLVKEYGYFTGFLKRITTYAVERKQVAMNRQVILLAPIKIFAGVAAWIATCLLDGKTLSRFNPVVHTSDGVPFVRMRIHTREGTYISTARAGDMLSIKVSANIDDAVAAVNRVGTNKLALSTVLSWVGPDARAGATILTEFHQKMYGRHRIPTVFPVDLAVRAYSYDVRNVVTVEHPKLQAFMCPFVHGAFAPVPNKAGEEQCVEGRIKSLRKPEPPFHSFREQCMMEFADLCAAGMALHPVDYEVVSDKQTSAAQKLSLERANTFGPFIQMILRCFIKAEAYPDVKDPRNISTYNDIDKLSMAKFALALSDHLKQFKWYGPGKTPIEIAERIVEICEKALFLNISDYRRMDGTVTNTLRGVDRAVMMKVFRGYLALVNELLKRNVDNTGVLPLGTKFDQGPSQGSGCSATSLFQTIRAAFTSYLAYRHTRRPDGTTYSPEQAFDALGVHVGDDGADPDLPTASHEWAAKLVGLVLESSVVHRGEAGVNFLARYYSSEVWFGRPDSMCDVRRQLSKFHTTVRLPDNVPAEHKLVEKAMAYVATDGNTPVIGPFCKKVLMLSSFRPTTPLGVGTWWSKFAESTQYPNSNDDGWMDVEFRRQFAEFDHTLFNEWLDSATGVEALLAPPLCAEPRAPTPSSVDVIVDEDIVRAREVEESPEPEPTEKAASEAPSNNLKRNRRRAKKTKPGSRL